MSIFFAIILFLLKYKNSLIHTQSGQDYLKYKIFRKLKVFSLYNYLSGLYFVPIRKHTKGILILISQQIKVAKQDNNTVPIYKTQVWFSITLYNMYWNNTTHIK